MYFEDYTLDMEWELAEVDIPKEEMLDYGLKYDIAPVHADEEYGRKSRFGEIIAPGTYTGMKLMCRWMEYGLPGEEFLAGTQSTFEWFVPVYAGDRLHGKALVSKKIENNIHNGFIHINILGYNQREEHVLTIHNHLVIKRKSDIDFETLKNWLASEEAQGEESIVLPEMTSAQIERMTENELIDIVKKSGANIDRFIRKKEKKERIV